MSKASFKKPPLYQTAFEVGSLHHIDAESLARVIDRQRREFFRWAPDSNCKFCRGELERLDSRMRQGITSDNYWIRARQSVRGCLDCGWWRYEFERSTEIQSIRSVAIGSVLRTDDTKFWAPVPVLRDFIAKNPDYLRTDIDPIVLEQLLRDVFSDYFDAEVRWTGRGKDGGFDLFHVLSNEPCLYQVKRRGPTSSAESVVPLRALLGTMVVRGAVDGIYVTTADRFTGPAQQEAEWARERGYNLQLLDYRALLDVLEATLPKNVRPYEPPWRQDSSFYEEIAGRVDFEV